MEISDDLLCVFNAQLERRDGTHVIEIPEREIHLGDVEPGDVYCVALLPSTGESPEADSNAMDQDSQSRPQNQNPPVEQGDRREVVIESHGDQGDGIAKVERGFVIIVEGADVGDEVLVEITNVAGSYAIGEVVGEATTSID